MFKKLNPFPHTLQQALYLSITWALCMAFSRDEVSWMSVFQWNWLTNSPGKCSSCFFLTYAILGLKCWLLDCLFSNKDSKDWNSIWFLAWQIYFINWAMLLGRFHLSQINSSIKIKENENLDLILSLLLLYLW